jgi:hypothetical protein
MVSQQKDIEEHIMENHAKKNSHKQDLKEEQIKAFRQVGTCLS